MFLQKNCQIDTWNYPVICDDFLHHFMKGWRFCIQIVTYGAENLIILHLIWKEATAGHRFEGTLVKSISGTSGTGGTRRTAPPPTNLCPPWPRSHSGCVCSSLARWASAWLDPRTCCCPFCCCKSQRSVCFSVCRGQTRSAGSELQSRPQTRAKNDHSHNCVGPLAVHRHKRVGYVQQGHALRLSEVDVDHFFQHFLRHFFRCCVGDPVRLCWKRRQSKVMLRSKWVSNLLCSLYLIHDRLMQYLSVMSQNSNSLFD